MKKKYTVEKDLSNSKPSLGLFNSLRRKKNNKKSESEFQKDALYDKEKNNIQNRPLPDMPIVNSENTDNSSGYETISESESDYSSIEEISTKKSNQNNDLSDSPLIIWNNLSSKDQEILKSIGSNDIFESIKSAIRESSGNKNDYRYALAKFSFDFLINPYKQVQENTNYISMNGMKTSDDVESLFEKMVFIISGNFAELFHTKIPVDDACKNHYKTMKGNETEPAYMNKLTLRQSLFNQVQEIEVEEAQDLIGSQPIISN